MTWWRLGLNTGLNLMSLTTAATWDPPKGHKHRVYSDGTFSFRESEIAGNFDCVEEQLWAFRNGLSNIVFALTIKAPRNPGKYFNSNKKSY